MGWGAGSLVWTVGGVGSKCFLVPGLLVWALVWVGGVGCWRGILKLRRGVHSFNLVQFTILKMLILTGGGPQEGINLLF